jgi:uncharacterized membrane-anchored protein
MAVDLGERDHPARAALMAETHARPTLRALAPCTGLHEAFVNEDAAAARAWMADWCGRIGVAGPKAGAGLHVVEHAGAVWKWERHGEFCAWTVILPAGHPAAVADAPGPWPAGRPGSRIAAVRIAVQTVDTLPDQPSVDVAPGVELAGMTVCGGEATVWTGLVADAAGFVRYGLDARGLNPERLGRLVRRLFEIETYRMVAMLAFPVSRDMRADLDRLDADVRRATGGEQAGEGTPESAEAALDLLMRAARDVESLLARSDFRFGAAAAYRTLVEKRLEELREARIEGHQRLSTFLARRFSPAMDTVAATRRRLETLAERIARASTLLRTRIDLERSRNTEKLLQSVERRARLQLRLQQTVEGVSVVAISYYAWALLSKLVQGVSRPPGSPAYAWIDALLVLLVLGVVIAGRVALSRRIESEGRALDLDL